MTWTEVPEVAVPHRFSTADRIVATGLLSGVPLWAQFGKQNYGFDPARPVLGIVLAAAVALALFRSWTAIVPAVGIVVGMHAVGGSYAAVHLSPIVVASVAAWAMATGLIGDPLRRIRPAIALRPAIPLLVAADAILLARPGVRIPLVLFVAALATGFVVACTRDHGAALAARIEAAVSPVSRVVRFVSRGVDAVAVRFGRLVAGIAMVPAAAVITVTWGANQLLRFDPLRSGGTDARWRRRYGSDPTPDRLYPLVATPGRTTPQRSLASLLTIALVGGAVVGVGAWWRHTSSRPDDARAASTDDRSMKPSGSRADGVNSTIPPGDPGVPEDPRVYDETNEYILHAHFDPATTYRIDDFAGVLVNVENGIRRTWAPPACTCRRIKVWWYGGSAAWGYTQRDLHSLPSQLARAAWKQGIALDIENRATPGWVFGQSVRDFVSLATTTSDRPDLVIFYDGGNDMARQFDRAKRGDGNNDSEISWLEDTFDDIVEHGPFVEDRSVTPATTTTIQLDHWLDPEILGRRTMDRYLRDADLARAVAASLGIVPVFTWQPLSVDVPDALSTAPMDHGEAAVWRTALKAARPRLPADGIDLSKVLDGAKEPVFKDLYHNNEPGAEIIGTALFDRLSTRLTTLAATPASTTTVPGTPGAAPGSSSTTSPGAPSTAPGGSSTPAAAPSSTAVSR